MSLHVLLLLCTLLGLSHGARCRYRESRVREQVFVRRSCNSKLSQLGEEYWTSVGYDGRLRNGRVTDDFLTLPQSGEGDIREGWVAYWITKTRYGQGLHYEAFGHAFLRRDGRICAWFAGRDRDAIELCGGFRVLSRNKNNPDEEMPFEWIQAGYARPRETLGFHHHRIAKYEWSPDDVFFGDAHLRSSTFRGVSPISRFYMEMTTPDVFARKVWVLRRKPESIAGIGGGVRSEWASHRNRQDRRNSEIGGGARPSWSSAAKPNKYDGQPSRPRVQHVAAPQEQSGYSSNNERNQVDQDTKRQVERPSPEWTSRTDSRHVYGDADSPNRNHVRFRYVKPVLVNTDEYGRLYRPTAKEGAKEPRAESAAVESRQIPGYGDSLAQQHSRRVDVEEPRTEATVVDPRRLAGHGDNRAQEHSRRIDDYEGRRRAHHEQYLRLLEQRRQDAARLRADEERRREQMAIQAQKDHQQQQARQDAYENDNSITRDILNEKSDEISSYPEPLPTPRAVLKEEVEDLNT